jgi:thiol-disulfide isomerase/thioredoxin
MHKIIIALGLAIIAMVLIRVYRRAKFYGFDDYEGFSTNGKELLIVKAGWCGHCKSAMPEFQKLVKASPVKLKDGSSVTIRMLDDKENKSEIKTLPIDGFPSILYRDGGKTMAYSGERTYDGVMGFLQSM